LRNNRFLDAYRLDAYRQGVNGLFRKRREIFELQTKYDLSSIEIADKHGISMITKNPNLPKPIIF
jgi:DNA-directed RNA polymerase specialized sigma24 family protein